MTKKDYIGLAAALRTTRDAYAHHGEKILLRACDDHALRIAEVLRRDNVRFDRALFLDACGVKS